MFEALENNPVLRERVLGLTAIAAVLVGGAAGIDTMLTSGWQIGGTSGAPVVYAEAIPQQYFDDVGRDWTTASPRRVQLAAQDTVVTIDPARNSDDLDGPTDRVVTPAAPPPSHQSNQPEPNSDAQQQQAANQRFDAIENDVQQATAALEPDTVTKDASETASPS